MLNYLGRKIQLCTLVNSEIAEIDQTNGRRLGTNHGGGV